MEQSSRVELVSCSFHLFIGRRVGYKRVWDYFVVSCHYYSSLRGGFCHPSKGEGAKICCGILFALLSKKCKLNNFFGNFLFRLQPFHFPISPYFPLGWLVFPYLDFSSTFRGLLVVHIFRDLKVIFFLRGYAIFA